MLTDDRRYNMCGIGGRCYQHNGFSGFGEGDTAATVRPASSQPEPTSRSMFLRAIGVGVGVTIAVRLIDRFILRKIIA
jgi:hypothetical protein